jgi:6-pyruvoyltetrahydropterin/6-carboxytetrahydropterin synthase
MITASRYHDLSCGHRVHGHESKCAHLHGHNYRVHFTVSPVAGLDTVGRVLDFSAIKTRLCDWLEDNWDHRFLIYDQDPMAAELRLIDPEGVVEVPFNPTAENMAKWLLHIVGPSALEGTGCKLIEVTVEETRKCSASAGLTSTNRI